MKFVRYLGRILSIAVTAFIMLASAGVSLYYLGFGAWWTYKHLPAAILWVAIIVVAIVYGMIYEAGVRKARVIT